MEVIGVMPRDEADPSRDWSVGMEVLVEDDPDPNLVASLEVTRVIARDGKLDPNRGTFFSGGGSTSQVSTKTQFRYCERAFTDLEFCLFPYSSRDWSS
jgi:hypothetical protein